MLTPHARLLQGLVKNIYRFRVVLYQKEGNILPLTEPVVGATTIGWGGVLFGGKTEGGFVAG
jgi:hypothetical protein